MKTKFNISRFASGSLWVLGLMVLVQVGFTMADLFFLKRPVFYRQNNCPGIKTGVLLLNCLSLLIILGAACTLYFLFMNILKEKQWTSKHAWKVRICCVFIVFGFYLSEMGTLIANDFLKKPSAIGCPLFWNMVTGAYYAKNTLFNLVFQPGTWVLVLCMVLLTDLLRYTYPIKKENEFFI